MLTRAADDLAVRAQRGDADGRARARLPRRRRAARGGAHERDPRRARSTASRARRACSPTSGAPIAAALQRGLRAGRGDAGEAAPVPPPRRRARRLPRGRHRARRSCSLHSALLSHREWEPVVEHLTRPLPARAPRPAAARRLRGPPAPPVHARLVRRGDGGVLPRDGRAEPARRRPRPRRRDPAARGRDRAARARQARAHAQLPAPPARARRAAVGVAGGDARRRACPGSTASSATARGARSAPTSA